MPLYLPVGFLDHNLGIHIHHHLNTHECIHFLIREHQPKPTLLGGHTSGTPTQLRYHNHTSFAFHRLEIKIKYDELLIGSIFIPKKREYYYINLRKQKLWNSQFNLPVATELSVDCVCLTLASPSGEVPVSMQLSRPLASGRSPRKLLNSLKNVRSFFQAFPDFLQESLYVLNSALRCFAFVRHCFQLRPGKPCFATDLAISE